METKAERRQRQSACKHKQQGKWVTFKDGTHHFAVRCKRCDKFFGYQKKVHPGNRAYLPERVPGLDYDEQAAEEQDLFRQGLLS